MTAEEWLAETEKPLDLLGAIPERSLAHYHFSMACCRRFWEYLTSEDLRHLIVYRENDSRWQGVESQTQNFSFIHLIDQLAWNSIYLRASQAAMAWVAAFTGPINNAWACDVIRDVADGPCDPLRPVALWGSGSYNRWAVIDPAGKVSPLLRQLADVRGEMDPLLLLALADALEEHGCDNHALLNHLRDPSPHVRGCRGVELLATAIREES